MSEGDKTNIRRDYDNLNHLNRETELLSNQEKILIKLIKLYGKYLCQTDAYHEINYELAMNNIRSFDLDSNL